MTKPFVLLKGLLVFHCFTRVCKKSSAKVRKYYRGCRAHRWYPGNVISIFRKYRRIRKNMLRPILPYPSSDSERPIVDKNHCFCLNVVFSEDIRIGTVVRTNSHVTSVRSKMDVAIVHFQLFQYQITSD